MKTNPINPSGDKSIDLTRSVELVQDHFRKICCEMLTFSVLASLDEKKLPYIAMRIKEHCFLEEDFRVHDIIVNRDGSIYSTKFIGIDGKGILPGFTGR